MTGGRRDIASAIYCGPLCDVGEDVDKRYESVAIIDSFVIGRMLCATQHACNIVIAHIEVCERVHVTHCLDNRDTIILLARAVARSDSLAQSSHYCSTVRTRDSRHVKERHQHVPGEACP